MFEKEAEKYLIKLLKRLKIRKENLAENQPEIQSWEKINFVSLNTSNVSKAYQKGAEFGYNKAKEEMQEQGLALQSDMDKTIEQNIALKKELEKANEWHYVNWEYIADKDYPTSDTSSYLVQTRDYGLLICDWEVEEGFGYFYDRDLDPIDNDEIYAWKEIVPTKGSE